MAEQRLSDLDFRGLREREFFPSPAVWEDQVLYFLLLDRFSDGNEQGYRDNDGHLVTGGTTPMFQPADRDNAVQTPDDARRWREAGVAGSAATCRGCEARSATSSASASRPSGSAPSSSRSDFRRRITAMASRTSWTSTRSSALARICERWSRPRTITGFA